MPAITFHTRRSVEQVEEGFDLAPKFDGCGLLPCVTTDATSHEVLMLGWMNAEALRQTLETGEAHYFRRSRREIWRKGATSGLVQNVVEARVDVGGVGGSCHVGYRSCFYRTIPTGQQAGGALTFNESRKAFDPIATYGDTPNPTRL